MPPQIALEIEAQLTASVLSRIAKGETDPETGSWVFSALFFSFLLFAALLLWRLLMIERRMDRIQKEVDSSDELESVDE